MSRLEGLTLDHLDAGTVDVLRATRFLTVDLRVHLVMRVDDAVGAPNVTIDRAYPEDTLEPIARFHHATAAILPT